MSFKLSLYYNVRAVVARASRKPGVARDAQTQQDTPDHKEFAKRGQAKPCWLMGGRRLRITVLRSPLRKNCNELRAKRNGHTSLCTG